MQLKRGSDQRGFTILEIMIATTVFAVVMLLLAAGVLGFARSYFAGVTRSNTQAAARSVMDDLARATQFASSDPVTTIPDRVCIGNVAYFYKIGQQLTATNHSLVKRVYAGASSCTSDVSPVANAGSFNTNTDQELLIRGARVTELSIVQPGGGSIEISVRIVYGDDDLIFTSVPATPAEWAAVKCLGGIGSQYCAVSSLATTVQRRIE